MPAEEQGVAHWRIELAVELHHHLGDSLLCGCNLAVVCGKAEVAADGGLQTIAIQNLALDFGGIEGFLADEIDRDLLPVAFRDMSDTPREDPRLQQELRLHSIQFAPLETERGPIRLLPVPVRVDHHGAKVGGLYVTFPVNGEQ